MEEDKGLQPLVLEGNYKIGFKHGSENMKIDAEVSLYPLRNADLSKPIGRFLGQLQETGLEVEPGPMSSHIAGECSDLFRALGDAFEKSAEEGDVMLVVKVSNACGSFGNGEDVESQS